MLKNLSSRDLKLLAYTLGYVTHYATDVTFHPFVYAHARNSMWTHARIESAMDAQFQQSISIPDSHATLLSHRLTAEDETLLFTAYSAIAVQCGFPPLQKPAFLRSIARFHSYPPVPRFLFSKTQHIYPTKEADALFIKAVDWAEVLFSELLTDVKKQTPLPKALFGKNYLTGQ